MRLKDYLRQYIEKKIQYHKEAKMDSEIAQKIIEGMSIRNADYIVTLESVWKDEGEKSVTVEHTGTIDAAIKAAEAEFKNTNHTNDVQATYHVELCLDVVNITIPPQYYKR
jgi:hypothetical protein